MTKLTIPKRYQAGVAKIRELDERTAQEFRDSLDRSFALGTPDQSDSFGKSLDALATSAISSEAKPSTIDLKKTAETIIALYRVKAMRDVSVDEFAEYVTEAMESLESENLRLPHEEREQFKKKLIILLGATAIGIVTKAADLQMENERLFCSGRILTDLRPVFGFRVEDGPQGMVVVHQLKLSYHTGSEELHEFFISLNSEDLRSLRGLIDRAEAKARSIKSSLKDVRLFGITKE